MVVHTCNLRILGGDKQIKSVMPSRLQEMLYLSPSASIELFPSFFKVHRSTEAVDVITLFVHCNLA